MTFQVSGRFERATEIAPSLLGAQFLLASGYEADGEFDAAIARYRTISSCRPTRHSG